MNEKVNDKYVLNNKKNKRLYVVYIFPNEPH